MFKRLKIFTLVLLTAGAGFAADTWTELSLASNAQVSFPGAPQVKISSEATPVGPVTTNTYELKADGYSLTACRTKLPKIATAFQSADALYEEASKSLLKEFPGAQKTGYQAVTVAGKPGAQMSFKTASGEEGKARFVLLDETLVTTQAVWKDAKSYANVERFFNSVR